MILRRAPGGLRRANMSIHTLQRSNFSVWAKLINAHQKVNPLRHKLRDERNKRPMLFIRLFVFGIFCLSGSVYYSVHRVFDRFRPQDTDLELVYKTSKDPDPKA